MGAESMNRARVLRVALHVGLWSITLFEVFELGQAGLRKFTSMDVWWGLFENWGFPFWFLVVVGVAELGGAVLLLVPRLAAYAAAGLIVVMAGSLATELFKEKLFGPWFPLMHIVLLSVIAMARYRMAQATSALTVRSPSSPSPRLPKAEVVPSDE
jgi:uncharacterized membrane protein YphA (DoxX/SURF4 family)